MHHTPTSARGKPEIPFDDLERKLPELFAEMRADLETSPFTHEIILIGKKWIYNHDPSKPVFMYYFEDHQNLTGKLSILQNHGLVQDIKFNDVDRFIFTEEFVNYLTQNRERDSIKRSL